MPLWSARTPYNAGPIDLDVVSPAFRTFLRLFFENSFELLHNGDVEFFMHMSLDEINAARDLLRANLHLGYTHIIMGVAELEDALAVDQLRSMLVTERHLSAKLTIAGALWRISHDAIFSELVQDMIGSASTNLRQAHVKDVSCLRNRMAIEVLIRLLDDADRFVRFKALMELNTIEGLEKPIRSAQDLPHDTAYYQARMTDLGFLDMMEDRLKNDPKRRWPVW